MTINITKIFSYVIIFLVGIVFSKMFLDKKCPEVIIKAPVITTTETADTSINKKEIVSNVPAKIKPKPKVSITPKSPEVGAGINPCAAEGHYVATYDTTTEDGFEAHIFFDSEDRRFYNRFVMPSYTITKEKIITVDNSKEIIVSELPKYLIGLGVKTFYKDNTINTTPFLSFSANRKLWFMVATLELKALTRMNAGSIKMEPEIEGKINVPL